MPNVVIRLTINSEDDPELYSRLAGISNAGRGKRRRAEVLRELAKAGYLALSHIGIPAETLVKQNHIPSKRASGIPNEFRQEVTNNPNPILDEAAANFSFEIGTSKQPKEDVENKLEDFMDFSLFN